MKLYHNPLSPNSRRVRMTAILSGVSVDEQVLDLMKGEHKSPEFLAINPNGMIPALVDGDLKLNESRAIARYIAKKGSSGALLPSDPQGEADVLRWQFWDAAHFATAIFTLTFENVLKGMFGAGDPDPAQVEKGMAEYERFADVLNTSLEGKQYLVGNALTLADITVASTLTLADVLKLPVDDTPNVKAWLGRIKELDAWKQTEPPL